METATRIPRIFLLYFADPKANATLRDFGRLLHEFVLEFWRMRPSHQGRIFTVQLRAEPEDPIRAAAAALGRLGGLKGGKARSQKMTPEERRKSARKAAQARWKR